VEQAGFEAVETTLDLGEVPPPDPLVVTLSPSASRLRLRSEPAEATVRIDGEPVGTTPLSDHALSAGSHQILVEREGYRPWALEVATGPGESLNLVARLTAETPPRPSGVRESAKPAPASPPTVRAGDLVELGPDVSPPRKVSGDPAAYPDVARRARREGSVTVEMVVSEEGVPTELKIVESAGEVLDQAVLKALAGWRYQPAQKAGINVRVRWQVRQSFRLGS
jgi:TonB family protein